MGVSSVSLGSLGFRLVVLKKEHRISAASRSSVEGFLFSGTVFVGVAARVGIFWVCGCIGKKALD